MFLLLVWMVAISVGRCWDIVIPSYLLDFDGPLPKEFVFDSRDPFIEDTVRDLCFQYRIAQTSCYALFEEAIYQQLNGNQNLFTDDSIELKYKKVSEFMPSASRTPMVIANVVDSNRLSESDIVSQIISAVGRITLYPGRFVIVHSCGTMADNNFDVLRIVLDGFLKAGMVDGSSLVVVLNYGERVPEAVQQLALNLFGGFILFFEVGRQTVLYELPSLRLVKLLSDQLVASGLVNSQILYVHTKGVSYSTRYQSIEDWRTMMMYFLVERQMSCYYLLASGEFDVVGINYKSNNTSPHFSGNFWWATVRYLSSVPIIEYGRYRRTNKLSAEYWVLSPYRELNEDGSYKTVPRPNRVHSMHQSGVDHYQNMYPRHRYVAVPTAVL